MRKDNLLILLKLKSGCFRISRVNFRFNLFLISDYNISITSSSSNNQPEYHSVATPALISALCKLFTNMITLSPHDTVVALQEHNIINSLVK